MNPWAQSGRQYWQNELKNMLGIQSGATQPTAFPEYKGMANQYNAQSNQELSRIVQQLGQRGITGGAAAGVMQNSQNNTNQNLLKMIQNMYQSSNQRGGIAADKGIDWQKFLMNYELMSDQQKAQNRQAGFGQWMGVGKTVASMIAGAMPGGMGGAALGAGAGGGGTGGVTSTPGGLSDYYNKMYGGSTFLK